MINLPGKKVGEVKVVSTGGETPETECSFNKATTSEIINANNMANYIIEEINEKIINVICFAFDFIQLYGKLSCCSGKWKRRYGISFIHQQRSICYKDVQVTVDNAKPFLARVVKERNQTDAELNMV